VFRLYFVDAPETGAAFGERVEDQAAYFGLPPADIPALGKAAKEFARERLAQEFTVVTRWQNARGMSSLARFYAIVLVRGQNLAYDLVSAGFARIHGLRATWPEGERASTVLSRLKNAELAAREKKLGAWGWTKAATAQAGPENSAASGKPPAPKSATPAPLVDLNSATAAALMTLPGIGEKLAERIIAARPYATVEDLTRVSGIGPKTFERLRPLVTVAAK
jgi:competence protein ComEA